MKRFKRLQWIPDAGPEINMGYLPPFYFTHLGDSVQSSAETVKTPRREGVSTVYLTVGGRSINIEGKVRGVGAEALANLEYREMQLMSAFDPGGFGTLIAHGLTGSYRIRCRPLASPTFGRRAARVRTFDIDLASDSPFWEENDERVHEIGKSVALWTFPWRLPTTFGYYYKSAKIVNSTHREIRPIIEIRSTSEFVRVRNVTTSKLVEITMAIGEGQKMVVDCDRMRVTLHRDIDGIWRETADVTNCITLDSEFWTLVPGENVVKVENEMQEEQPLALIRYRVPAVGF